MSIIDKNKINILIIGAGMYSTGITVLGGEKETDKDFGVVLPSILELHQQGLVGDIYIANRNGKKFIDLKKKLDLMRSKFGWAGEVKLFPNQDEINPDAYKEALVKLPKPAAAIIVTPDFLHKEMIIEAIKNKVHFLVVKPAVTNAEDLEEIISKQKKAGLLGMVDYHKVYDEANLMLKDDYENDKYGDIQHIFSKQTQRRDMLEIFRNWLDKTVNINHYLGSHYIHLVGFITKAIPLNVRATSQFGVAKEEYGIDTADLIETQIVWRAKNGSFFSSYHLAGWSDPSETSGMTYQDIHIIGTKGHINSEQRYRGFETVLTGQGQGIINPYFFHLHKGLLGNPELEGKYGFKSIKTFVKCVSGVENGISADDFEDKLPTIKDSRIVTAILEAADKSLANNSEIISLNL